MRLFIPGVTDELIQQEYYHGLIPREDLPQLLRKNGEFILRITEPQKGMAQSVVLSLMWNRSLPAAKGMKHFVVRQDAAGLFYVTRNMPYSTIRELIKDYRAKGLSIDGQDPTMKIKKGVPRMEWEIPNSAVSIGEKIGQGAYGEVCKGTVGGNYVAIKQNHMVDLNKAQVKEIMSEARVMRKFRHPNIVSLIGIAALDEPLYIIMELASDGSLLSYLTKRGSYIDMQKRAVMCHQLAWALQHLREKNVLHRDLALRNCLYHNGVVKLSDFGKSQPGPTYIMEPDERLPIRWLSPETLTKRVFDFASEVWSFGIVCWEIYANGQEPYPNMMVRDVNIKVVQGTACLRMPLATPQVVRTLVEKHILVPAAQRTDIDNVVVQLELYTKLKPPVLAPNTRSRKMDPQSDTKKSEKSRQD